MIGKEKAPNAKLQVPWTQPDTGLLAPGPIGWRADLTWYDIGPTVKAEYPKAVETRESEKKKSKLFIIFSSLLAQILLTAADRAGHLRDTEQD